MKVWSVLYQLFHNVRKNISTADHTYHSLIDTNPIPHESDKCFWHQPFLIYFSDFKIKIRHLTSRRYNFCVIYPFRHPILRRILGYSIFPISENLQRKGVPPFGTEQYDIYHLNTQSTTTYDCRSSLPLGISAVTRRSHKIIQPINIIYPITQLSRSWPFQFLATLHAILKSK